MDKTELKIFHIAGITELYKNDLIEKLKKLKMFVICDLDLETEKIYKNKEILSKIKELESTLVKTAPPSASIEVTTSPS